MTRRRKSGRSCLGVGGGVEEVFGGAEKGVLFDRYGCVAIQPEQAELAVVGDEYKVVAEEVAAGLGGTGEFVEGDCCGLDFDGSAFGELGGWRGSGCAAGLASALGEETSVGLASSVVAELGGEEDFGFEGVAGGVEEV
jgi:hypothetical protein